MIVARAPIGISLLGAWTDKKEWYEKHNGLILGAAIDKYVHKVGRIDANGITQAEIFSDIPCAAQTVVVAGYYHDLTSNGLRVDREQLVRNASLGDFPQGPYATSVYGGLNVFRFSEHGIHRQVCSLRNHDLIDLEEHALLFPITNDGNPARLTDDALFATHAYASNGIDSLYKKDWEQLGRVVGKSWEIRMPSEASPWLNEVYTKARLLGAWGGGVDHNLLFFLAPPNKQGKIIEGLKSEGLKHLPFKFDWEGAKICYLERNDV